MLSFPDIKMRYELKLICQKMMSLLIEKLIEEKLEPISIKIDCDKNKYPDIIDSLKDKRNWV